MRDLLKCLNVVQAFMEQETVCKLVLHKWNELKEIVSCLKVLYQATIVMQKEDFKLSDFYATWLYIDKKLKKNMGKQNTTNLAKHLIVMLEKSFKIPQ